MLLFQADPSSFSHNSEVPSVKVCMICKHVFFVVNGSPCLPTHHVKMNKLLEHTVPLSLSTGHSTLSYRFVAFAGKATVAPGWHLETAILCHVRLSALYWQPRGQSNQLRSTNFWKKSSTLPHRVEVVQVNIGTLCDDSPVSSSELRKRFACLSGRSSVWSGHGLLLFGYTPLLPASLLPLDRFTLWPKRHSHCFYLAHSGYHSLCVSQTLWVTGRQTK